MKTSLLKQKLEACDDDQLARLHNKLIEICTGKPVLEHPEVSRHFSVIETTDCMRGALLFELIGKGLDLDDFWIPANRGDRLFPHTRLSFISDPEVEQPTFKLAHPGQDPQVVEDEEARDYAAEGTRDDPTHILIVANFPKLYPGWKITSEPPLPPTGAIYSWARTQDPGHSWIMACYDSRSAQSILSPFNITGEDLEQSVTPPLLAVLTENTDPSSSCCEHVPFLNNILEVTELISSFIQQVEGRVRPNRARRIYSILKCNADALKVRKQVNKRERQHLEFTIQLEEAKIKWEKLFLNENRESIRDLRLESVAHTMAKWRLLSHNAREARANLYARKELYPRIELFFRETLLEFIKIHNGGRNQVDDASIEESSSDEIVDLVNDQESASFLRRGIAQALPSLGLLIPVSMMNIPQFNSAIEGLDAEPSGIADKAGSVESELVRDTPRDDGGGWIAKAKRKGAEKRDELLKPVTERLDSIKEGQQELREGQEETNEKLGQLADIFIAGGAAGAIGGLLAGTTLSVIAVKSAVALRHAEELIQDIIETTKASWPQIEQELRAIAYCLNGEIDETIINKSHRVLKLLDEF